MGRTGLSCRMGCLSETPASLSKKEQEQLESLVAELLEKRLSLQERIGELESLELPIQDFPVNNLDDAEAAASALRQTVGLGDRTNYKPIGCA